MITKQTDALHRASIELTSDIERFSIKNDATHSEEETGARVCFGQGR